MDQEHHVFYSLCTPITLKGFPAKYISTVLGISSILYLYIGILFSVSFIKWIVITFVLISFIYGKYKTHQDPFWFEVFIANINFFKSPKALKNEIIYRA
jgi:4-hydroxybenzoate polyprenyltransferase